MASTVSPFAVRILLRRTVALQASRRNFAELKHVRRNEFGSIHQTTIPIEKPIRPKRDFDTPRPSTSRNRMRVLSIDAFRKKPETVDISSEQSAVECSRKDFDANRYENGQLVLFSRHWDKNKYKDQWIKIRKVNKQAKSTIPNAMCSWEEFVPDLLDPAVAESLKSLEFRQPTHIQARMLKYFLFENHLFLAAETGSGKTVAYAAPLISYLSHQKKRNRPLKAVVVVATSTLSHQTAAVLSILAEGSGIRVASTKTEGDAENSSWDVLIGTPGLVAKALQSLPKDDIISHLVLDEADILLDESFVDVITDILSVVPVAHSETNLSENRNLGAKVVFCSASCPEDLECIVEGVVDRRKLSYVKSDGLHKLLPSVDLTFIRIREMDKFERLCKLIDDDMKRGEQNQTIVFCKDKNTAKFVEAQLLASGREALLWQSRCSPVEADDARIIVATDVASRGLDLPRLSHVIQYDMAKHAVDFVHRMGRVGRLSSLFAGRVTSFVRTAPEIRVTNQIELAARRGKPLHSIEADIAGMLKGKKGREEGEQQTDRNQ